MKNLFGFVVFVSTLLLSGAIVISYFLSYISPDIIGKLTLVCFAFPFLWIVGVLWCVACWVMRFWKTSFVILAACILTWGGISTVINIDFVSSHRNDGLKIMTYNMRGMLGRTNNGTKVADLVEYIKKESPDIVCLQEMVMDGNPLLRDYGNSLKKAFKDYYILTDADVYGKQIGNIGQVMLSRYPLKKVDADEVNKTNYMQKICIAAEVTIDDKKIVVYNCHLESIRLSPDERNSVKSVAVDAKDLKVSETTKSNIKKTLSKTATAFLSRAKQTEQLKRYVDNSKYPVVVCGDFNDTSISYTYQTLCSELTDAFVVSGHGWGYTYNGELPLLRIDHILYSAGLSSDNYNICDAELSDHYPVMCDIFFD